MKKRKIGNSGSIPGFKSWEHDLRTFQTAHASWIALHHVDETGTIYSLHRAQLEACVGLYRLEADDQAAEYDLAELCERRNVVGIHGNAFVDYPLLQVPPPWPSNVDLTGFKDYGWSQSAIAEIKSLSDPTAKVRHCLRSAAGRLVCMPRFNKAKDAIRKHWLQLAVADRPSLPLYRAIRGAARPKKTVEVTQAKTTKFQSKFDAFCDEWQLIGMTTWELPNVCGPNWVPGSISDERLSRGELAVTTPWHFPVLAEDGLGRVLEAEHRRQVAKRSITDAASWESYAHLFQIYFWEKGLADRYSKQQTIRGFKTRLEHVLAAILGVRLERLKRLRKWLHALQKGSLASLAGKR